ncbi:hypothetical protein GGE65_007107 [Skermanella aerolata]|uniref:hypothetical protein n=1 Tax=Skermanella aerolata TaxID=393310 RepID=UPI003D1BD978
MLRIIGLLFLAVSFGLIIYDIRTWPQSEQFPDLRGPGFGEGAAQRYLEEKNMAVGEVTKILSGAEDRGLVLARITSVSLWISFIASSLVTTLAGKDSPPRGSAGDAPPPGRRLRLIGLLGIAAALGTATAGFTEKQAKAAFKCVDDFEKVQAEVMEDVDKAPTSVMAKQYLDRMVGKAKQCDVWLGG